jgi:uncharacterized protein (DUF362 family)
MKTRTCSRRDFLQRNLAFAAGATAFGGFSWERLLAGEVAPTKAAGSAQNARVAIVPCAGYGPEVKAAMARSFDLLGGIGSLVRGKTVTVKLNLTGTNFAQYLNLPVGETYMTHYSTAAALAALLFQAGAKKVRFVESTQSRSSLETTLDLADWNVNELQSLGAVEFENTRNLGRSKSYSHLKVASGGNMFSSLDLNRAYEDTDVMVSLAKLKNHVTAGVTLSMKNCFGLTPNSLYGDQAGNEEATGGRGPLHNPTQFSKVQLPGLKTGITSTDPTWRVPRIIADICSARPIHLSIIDGISSMTGGEGPWCESAAKIELIKPRVLIAGLNPVSTDAVGTAVMGYDNPRALRGTRPFTVCDNHLLLAEQAGLGTADLSRIDVTGISIAKARCPFG